MIVFVHDWGSYFVVSEFFGTIAIWHCLNSFPALFFAAQLLSGNAKALVQPAAPWEGFSSSRDFSEEDFLAALACSAMMVSIHMLRQSTVAWNLLPLPYQECKFFTGQDK